jgi:general stress protein YciG
MATDDRGFASMDKDKQKEIDSEGGKASGTSRSNKTNSKASGAAGSTDAAKRGGEHSHKDS